MDAEALSLVDVFEDLSAEACEALFRIVAHIEQDHDLTYEKTIAALVKFAKIRLS